MKCICNVILKHSHPALLSVLKSVYATGNEKQPVSDDGARNRMHAMMGFRPETCAFPVRNMRAHSEPSHILHIRRMMHFRSFLTSRRLKKKVTQSHVLSVHNKMYAYALACLTPFTSTVLRLLLCSNTACTSPSVRTKTCSPYEEMRFVLERY